jgi:hypothetical protein
LLQTFMLCSTSTLPFLGSIILLPDQRLSALAHINWKNNVLPEDMGFGAANTRRQPGQKSSLFYSVLIDRRVARCAGRYPGEGPRRTSKKRVNTTEMEEL